MLFFGALLGTHVPQWTAENNVKFLRDHMNVELEKRSIQKVTIPKSSVNSGDLLGIIRLDGLDSMLAWAMGSRTGHTCVAMWIDGELYVCESTAKSNYWPVDGIQKTPWDEWISRAEKADFNVVHLKLSEEMAKRFDVKNATKFFNSVQGLPYGFHNQFTGWVDTAEGNFPPPLSSHLAMLLAPFGEWLIQRELKAGQTYDFVRQGLNHRLQTINLSIEEAYMEASRRGINFTTLVTMVEKDKWNYVNNEGKTGPSLVCCAFVTRMWKEGGLFGDLTDSIQATEFTDWDAYTLNFFAKNQNRSQDCLAADPNLPFCQLLGKYRMKIPDWNTVKPYSHMRERCPTLPPLYLKPEGC